MHKPTIYWIHTDIILPSEEDADSMGQVWVLGMNSEGTRRVLLESWRMVKYDKQYSQRWARTGV